MARQERAIRTRKAILAAAAEVFDDVGYEAATISEILKRSGLTKGALYFHFASKEELAQGVLNEQVAALPPVPAHELKLQMSIDEAVLLARLLQKGTGDPIVQGSMRLTVEQGGPKDLLDRRVPVEGWLEHTSALFEQAKAAGEILPHVDLARVVRVFVAAFTGVQVLSSILTGREDLQERVLDFYSYLMSAIASPGVLARLDFTLQRGEWVYAEAMRLHHERENTTPDH
ncbi:gamma-butyrolactone-binding protein [Streptomyces longispororuber]|uniref:Gamma-butyrolactone-binding protein n=1 Tax=Streptomyces longispororuber TaxID=68230 RepID=A0A919A725_9ACTN|nr:ScbR family autoregulator-binding transcription factor [Streptomyces longispororuber]GHE89977.1 gamma-butyrolactone-binding protein [Streptomyces longispororuber]